VGIAIEKGFHSLLEVFLRNGAPRDPRTLWSAVRWRRREMVELLFSYGADARAVSFQHVIAFNDPEIVKMFVDRGADLVTGYPLAGGDPMATRVAPTMQGTPSQPPGTDAPGEHGPPTFQ
jgi:hypothetical protein